MDNGVFIDKLFFTRCRNLIIFSLWEFLLKVVKMGAAWGIGPFTFNKHCWFKAIDYTKIYLPSIGITEVTQFQGFTINISPVVYPF